MDKTPMASTRQEAAAVEFPDQTNDEAGEGCSKSQIQVHEVSAVEKRNVQRSSTSSETTDDELEQDPHRPNLTKTRQIVLTLTLTGASFLNTASYQTVVVVLPTIARDLDIAPSSAQWVLSAYSLTLASFLLLWSRLADVFGRRMVFLIGSTAVSLGLLVCPFIPDEAGFDAVRALHGLGGAAAVPTAIGILGASMPLGPPKTYAISCFSAGFPLGSVLGNVLGAVLGQYAGWRWVFWILSILAALVVAVAFVVLPKDGATLRGSEPINRVVDWLGGLLITAGLLCLLLPLTLGNQVGWSRGWVVALIVVALVLIGLFVAWQAYLERTGRIIPLMKVSVWRSPRFAAAQFTMFFFFNGFNGFMFYATYYYQKYQGLSVIQTGVRFVPTGVVGLLAVFCVSQLLARVPVAHILAFSGASCAVACLLFALPLPPHTSYWAYAFEAMCLSVLGTDMLMPSLTLLSIQSVPAKDQAIGAGVVNAMGQVGRAVGLAVATAIQNAVQESRVRRGSTAKEALLAGYRAAFYWCFASCVACMLIAIIAMRGVGIIGVRRTKY